MNDRDRFHLLFGPYRPPRCRVGRWLKCAVRGRLKVRSVSDAPIQWPQARRADGCGRAFLIVTGALVKAIRQESAIAVAHWWGVSPLTVWTWRKALGVPSHTEGTRRLRRAWSPWSVGSAKAVRRRVAAARSPERRAKIAAARRGVPRPRHVIEAMRPRNLGRKLSPAYRAKLSAGQKRRWKAARTTGESSAWTPAQDAMLGTMLDRELAAKIGRTVGAVTQRRFKLGIPRAARRSKPKRK